ncbi:class I SAM-dependent methyltransferase [Solirubrobacter phytolaccae]|uniref:Class I SAM-dependent methyltransferase n=1 Tax=Solirubrobacter phytolaccae TaxID=1404360 RepID=A0A9X3NDT6_9ACTN|nr:class I SAM-dependent methyltransferase [Solirubrobacter phytolaccae]MDA0182276.1 class I SAM-dependent methyltransferase [Solirubrobacter phytolaccae]
MWTELRTARAAAYERARPEILEHVPPTARRVLDLGCATGTTGEALKARQEVEVTGIEIEPEYAREAETRLDRVLCADAASVPEDLEGPFDALIAADILEHLVDPWTTLKAYAALLEPGAAVVISLPNVNHWSTFAYLARGRWPRKPEGIFDATHLRWFTRADALDLLDHAGLKPHTVVRRRWLLTRGSRLDRLAPPLPLFTFQHVIAATKPA